MKKVLALVVIAGSITMFSCTNNDKKGGDAEKMKADSTRMADSTAKAKAKIDSAAKAAADTSKKAVIDTLKKDADKMKKDATKMGKDADKAKKATK